MHPITSLMTILPLVPFVTSLTYASPPKTPARRDTDAPPIVWVVNCRAEFDLPCANTNLNEDDCEGLCYCIQNGAHEGQMRCAGAGRGCDHNIVHYTCRHAGHCGCVAEN